MAPRLNWNKHRPRLAWAYTPIPTIRRHTRAEWLNAIDTRAINVLSERIHSARQWLDTIPSTDPRHKQWTNKLNELLAKRDTLKARIAQRNLH